MERPDGGLAPVSYLPGAQPPSGRSSHPAGSRRAPTFREMFGEPDGDPRAAEVTRAPSDDAAAQDGADDGERDEAAERARAENVSMHALTRRGQSRRELERLLRAREFSDEVIAFETDRLERVGLLDDIALAQNLVGILQERKGLGRTGIAAELTRRLLAPAAIEYALELVDSGDEVARARELAVKRAGQLRGYDRTTVERRLSGYLARRGYSGSAVRAAVQHALTAAPAVSGVRFR